MAHHRIIIIGKIADAMASLGESDPETETWADLQSAVDATETMLESSSVSQTVKDRIHDKQHELENFLVAGAPYDIETVAQFANELSGML